MSYTDEQVSFIIEAKEFSDDSWEEIKEKYNEKFNEKKTSETIRKTYSRYSNFELSEDVIIKNLMTTHRVKKTNSKIRKENKAILDELEQKEELEHLFAKMLKENKIGKVKLPKVKKNKGKKDIAMELIVTDIHVGLKTSSYDLNVCERRLEEYTRATLEDIEFQKKTHNITKLQINFLGDLMQGNHLHGSDSQASCELSDAEQLVEAIRVLFYKIILPLSKTGIKIEVLAIPGNHDRQSKDRPVTNASRRYLTWVIYNSLQMMTTEANLSNVNWTIAEKEYASFDMFGSHFIVVHGHTSGMKGTVDSMEKQLLKRSNQLGIIASGIRIGHFHAGFVSNNGRHIIGTSPVSDDSYGDHLGFVSYPGMMINYYVKTKKRDTSYYKTFEVNLSGIK